MPCFAVLWPPWRPRRLAEWSRYRWQSGSWLFSDPEWRSLLSVTEGFPSFGAACGPSSRAQYRRARSGILERPCWSGFAPNQGRQPVQDQIQAELEIFPKIGFRICRRLKNPGIYGSSQHWISTLVNQSSKELAVRQR